MKQHLIILSALAMLATLPALAQASYQGATANQVFGVNNNGSAPDPKTIAVSGLASVAHTPGTITLGATNFVAVQAKAANFSAVAGGMYVCSTASTATLPDATTSTGLLVVIRNTSGGSVTMASTSSQQIDGAAAGSTTIATTVCKKFVSNGTDWVSFI